MIEFMITQSRVPRRARCCHLLGPACITALVLSFSTPAQATLGEDASSIEGNRARLQATVRVQRRAKYAVHELQLPAGSKVRQFVAYKGKVFAISWSGGWRPDLRELMGSHYERYLVAMKGRGVPRGPVRLELPGMVLVMAGHQRAFFGHIYLTDHLPADTRLEDIH